MHAARCMAVYHVKLMLPVAIGYLWPVPPMPRRSVQREMKMPIFWPIPMTPPPNSLHLKLSLKCPRTAMKIWKRSSQPFQSYKHTKKHTYTYSTLCIDENINTDSVLSALEHHGILQSLWNTSIAPPWQSRLYGLLDEHKLTYLLTH